LTFNEDKTRIVHLDDGFDFLGFTARRRNGKLIIKPSKATVKRVRHRLAVEFRALRGTNPAAVLAKINPIVRGWANYKRRYGYYVTPLLVGDALVGRVDLARDNGTLRALSVHAEPGAGADLDAVRHAGRRLAGQLGCQEFTVDAARRPTA
jgi:hypothetical protein